MQTPDTNKMIWKQFGECKKRIAQAEQILEESKECMKELRRRDKNKGRGP